MSPGGAIAIARHFSARELAAFRACAVPAMQADYFRYCAVHELGGIYCDVDFRCHRNLRPLFDATDGGRIFAQSRDVFVNGFFMGSIFR